MTLTRKDAQKVKFPLAPKWKEMMGREEEEQEMEHRKEEEDVGGSSLEIWILNGSFVTEIESGAKPMGCCCHLRVLLQLFVCSRTFKRLNVNRKC